MWVTLIQEGVVMLTGEKQKNEQSTSCNQRIVYINNGVKQGNPQNAPRCNAKAKSTGKQCQAPAVRGNAKCRLHGGKSTGARTPEGLEKCRKANWKHGHYSLESKRIQFLFRALFREDNELLDEIL